MKSQDIFILLKLICLQQQPSRSCKQDRLADCYSARGLAAALGVSKSEINASIRRSIDVGMATKDRKSGYPKANRKVLLEFVVYGLKYVFPARPDAIARGIPTAFAAPVLNGKLLSMGDYIHVWSCAEGNEKGQSVQPLFKSVPVAALDDERLYEYLALVDAIRIGKPREANLATGLLQQRLSRNG